MNSVSLDPTNSFTNSYLDNSSTVKKVEKKTVKSVFQGAISSIGKAVSKIATVGKLSGIISKVIKFVQVVFGEDQFPVLDLIKTPIKAVKNLTGTFKVAQKTQDLLKLNKKSSGLRIAHKVISFVTSIFKTIKFLTSVGLIKLAEASAAIGKIPVLGFLCKIPLGIAINVLQLVTNVLGTAGDIKAFLAQKKQISKEEQKKAKWQLRSQNIDDILSYVRNETRLRELREYELEKKRAAERLESSIKSPEILPKVDYVEQPTHQQAAGDLNPYSMTPVIVQALNQVEYDNPEAANEVIEKYKLSGKDRPNIGLGKKNNVFDLEDRNDNLEAEVIEKYKPSGKDHPNILGKKDYAFGLKDFDLEVEDEDDLYEKSIQEFEKRERRRKGIIDDEDSNADILDLENINKDIDDLENLILDFDFSKHVVPVPPLEDSYLSNIELEDSQYAYPPNEPQDLQTKNPISDKNKQFNALEVDLHEIPTLENKVFEQLETITSLRDSLTRHYDDKIKAVLSKIDDLESMENSEGDLRHLRAKVIKWDTIVEAVNGNDSQIVEALKKEYLLKEEEKSSSIQVLKQAKIQKIFSFVYRIAKIILAAASIFLFFTGVGAVAALAVFIVWNILTYSFGIFKFFWQEKHPLKVS